MSPQAQTRRTQAQRSAETRRRLLEAALTAVARSGYAGATTVEIAGLAGVSRGAQVHHFPTRLDLMTAAADHLYTGAIHAAREMIREHRRAGAPPADLVDRLWSEFFNGRTWDATLELVVASRHDPALRTRLVPVVREFHDRLDALAMEFLEGAGLTEDRRKLLLNFSVCVLRGLGFQSVLKDDRAYFQNILSLLKKVMAEELEKEEGA